MVKSWDLLVKNLKQAIEDRGLTQREVAERAGIKPQYLSGILSGARSNLTLEIIVALAKAVEIPVARLFADEVTTSERIEHLVKVLSKDKRSLEGLKFLVSEDARDLRLDIMGHLAKCNRARLEVVEKVIRPLAQ